MTVKDESQVSKEVSKYDYIIVRTKSQLCWLNLPHLPILPPPVTAKQRVVTIPGDQPEEGINGYGGKDFAKRKVLRRDWENATKSHRVYLVIGCHNTQQTVRWLHFLAVKCV